MPSFLAWCQQSLSQIEFFPYSEDSHDVAAELHPGSDRLLTFLVEAVF
jgi:hypothetical protein